jgi:DUF3024 family protein
MKIAQFRFEPNGKTWALHWADRNAIYFEDDQTRDFVLSRVEWPEEFE